MVSIKSLYLFLLTNVVLAIEAIVTYNLFNLFAFSEPFALQSIGLATVTLSTKTYSLVKLIESGQRSKPLIGGDKRTVPKEAYRHEFLLRMILASFIEAVTFQIIFRLDFLQNRLDWKDSLTFLPLSFLFELIFDFFHYFTHRLLHAVPRLYTLFHKSHHKFHHPNAMTTFYQNPVDLVVSNAIPTLLALFIVTRFFEMSLFAFFLASTFKTFIEISGHTGKEEKTPSFVQFIWLPIWLGIDLHTQDHDLHHTRNNCNYAKRFSLYDKLFGTFAK